MKLVGKSIFSKIAVITCLHLCMLASAAEAYFCPDCDPARSRWALSASGSHCSASQEELTSDHATSQESELADVCPVCQSPPHVVNSYTLTTPAFVNVNSQDPPRLSGDIAGVIYKPPRIAS